MDVTLGQVVHSKAGRDRGRKFVIVGIENELFVRICDGDLRKIEKPKKKKLKHLELTDQVIEKLEQKLRRNEKVTNSEIRKALENIQ